MTRFRALLAHPRFADLVALIVLVLLAVSLLSIAVQGRPMSAVDEPTHYDTAIRVERGEYPHRGSVYTMSMVREWACGVSHETGRLLIACEDPALSPDVLPMTRWTTGYIHYPTYFVAVVAGSEALDAVAKPLGLSLPRIDRFRVISTLLLLAGVVACWLLARSCGVTGARRLAVTLAPVAAPGILSYGPMVNPGAAAVLCGALVALTGMRWARTGRGFGWHLAASLGAGLVAATASLPVAVFLLASGVSWIGARLGVARLAEWGVRWWQLALQALVFLGPVVAWGRYLEAGATAPNEVVYAVVAVTSMTKLLAGSLQELTTLHNPWSDVGMLNVVDESQLALFLRVPGYGLPLLISLLVFGILALALLGERGMTGEPVSSEVTPAATRWPAVLTGDRLLIACLFVVVFAFPPALRLSNALNFGVDFAIVPRYLTSLTPLAVLLAVRAVRGAGVPRALATISVVVVLGVCATAW